MKKIFSVLFVQLVLSVYAFACPPIETLYNDPGLWYGGCAPECYSTMYCGAQCVKTGNAVFEFQTCEPAASVVVKWQYPVFNKTSYVVNTELLSITPIPGVTYKIKKAGGLGKRVEIQFQELATGRTMDYIIRWDTSGKPDHAGFWK